MEVRKACWSHTQGTVVYRAFRTHLKGPRDDTPFPRQVLPMPKIHPVPSPLHFGHRHCFSQPLPGLPTSVPMAHLLDGPGCPLPYLPSHPEQDGHLCDLAACPPSCPPSCLSSACPHTPFCCAAADVLSSVSPMPTPSNAASRCGLGTFLA